MKTNRSNTYLNEEVNYKQKKLLKSPTSEGSKDATSLAKAYFVYILSLTHPKKAKEAREKIKIQDRELALVKDLKWKTNWKPRPGKRGPS